MMAGLDDWLSVARGGDADELRDRILTGFRSGKPFTPYVPTLELPAPTDDVLDFGCGVGRNFPYLRTLARRVSGFDLPPMIQRCRQLAPVEVDSLSDDWTEVAAKRFDLIFASLVFQHIEPDACRSYLRDFARMSPLLYLLTRTSSDFGTNVLDHCEEIAAFDAGDCTIVEHNPDTHQLDILGIRSFHELRTSGDEVHCEILLRSRVARTVGANGLMKREG
jgi:SAM-dependent methyltransferase